MLRAFRSRREVNRTYEVSTNHQRRKIHDFRVIVYRALKLPELPSLQAAIEVRFIVSLSLIAATALMGLIEAKQMIEPEVAAEPGAIVTTLSATSSLFEPYSEKSTVQSKS